MIHDVSNDGDGEQTSTHRCGLPGCLGGELLTRSLSCKSSQYLFRYSMKEKSTDLRWTCGRFAANDDDGHVSTAIRGALKRDTDLGTGHLYLRSLVVDIYVDS